MSRMIFSIWQSSLGCRLVLPWYTWVDDEALETYEKVTPQRWMHKLWSDMEDNPVIFLGLAFLLVRFRIDDVLVQWLLWMYRCNQLRSSTMTRPSPWPPAESPWDAEATLRQGLLHQWCSSPGGNGRSGCKWSSVQHHIKSIADISHWCVITSKLLYDRCFKCRHLYMNRWYWYVYQPRIYSVYAWKPNVEMLEAEFCKSTNVNYVMEGLLTEVRVDVESKNHCARILFLHGVYEGITSFK